MDPAMDGRDGVSLRAALAKDTGMGSNGPDFHGGRTETGRHDSVAA